MERNTSQGFEATPQPYRSQLDSLREGITIPEVIGSRDNLPLFVHIG